MKLDNIVAISGMPGLYKMAGSRSNGLIFEDMDSGKRRFASIRKHQFTPLESVSIYTMMDTKPLEDVLKSIDQQKVENGIPEANSNAAELQAWFGKVLSDYDPDKVLVSDIRKVIRWYNFLDSRQLLSSDEEE
jgi:hypothetical protein